MDFLNEHVLWWHWVVFGLLLFIGELLSGTFLLLGIGIAAVATGLLTWLLPLSFTAELLLWSAGSAVVMVFWYRRFRRAGEHESGQAGYRVDTPGTVTEPIEPPARGRVLFDAPVLGNREWPAFADRPIAKGTRVRIVEVSGQMIKVEEI